MKKTDRIFIRVTRDERVQIKQAARRDKTTISDYVLRRALQHREGCRCRKD